MLTDYWANRDIDAIKAFTRVRSAATYVEAINANRPAILMANSYGDSLFPGQSAGRLLSRLTGAQAARAGGRRPRPWLRPPG